MTETLNLREPTARQRAIYRSIVHSVQVNGRPPTLREIMARFGITTPNGVIGHLRALQYRGLIERSDRQCNGITVCGINWQPAFEATEEGRRLKSVYDHVLAAEGKDEPNLDAMYALGLTGRQYEMLRCLFQHTCAMGMTPTVRGIMRIFGWTSPHAPLNHFNLLVRKGFLRREPDHARNYQLAGVRWKPQFTDDAIGQWARRLFQGKKTS